MKLSVGQYYNIRYKMPLNPFASPAQNPSHFSDNNLSFKGDVANAVNVVFRKVNGNIICENANAFVNKMNSVFGNDKAEGYFSQKLSMLGIDPKSKSFTIKNRSFLKDDFLNTLLFPIRDTLPWAAQKLSNIFHFQLKKDGLIQTLINQKEQDAARYWILDNIEEFSKRQFGTKINLDERYKEYIDTISSSLPKVKKNYASRDERTLNRVVTSTVSAMYAGADFHNISMLEKDDKQEAKKAGKGRIKQELTRMALNASTTFIALGMLDRFTKKNIYLNAAVIALSALIAEVSSRIFSKTPLKPLSPEEAAEFAKKQKKNTKQEKQQNVSNAAEQNKNVAFKANLSEQNQIFAGFVSQNKASMVSQTENKLKENTASSPQKKKMSLKKTLAVAFGAATAIFFISRWLKGDYKALGEEKRLFERVSGNIEDIKKNETLAEEARKIFSDHKEATKQASILTSLKEKISKKEVEINLEKLKEDIAGLQKADGANEIKAMLENYIQNADEAIGRNNKNLIIKGKVDRFILSGVVDGVTKLVDMIYQILTLPAKGINFLIDSLFTKNTETTKKFEKLIKEIYKDPDQYTKELVELNSLIKKYNQKPEKVIDKIKNRIRNVETGAETGDLANISRTMVTAIGTYFFVNDYRNRVLIESEGKNTQGAKEEMNERIWHKVFNFVINGTLMNVFNTVFKVPVNNSLLGAATVAAATETTNEFLVRKSICQPVLPKHSKQEIIDFENEQVDKKGPWGAWSRFFKKITGKKSLTEKTGINNKQSK